MNFFEVGNEIYICTMSRNMSLKDSVKKSLIEIGHVLIKIQNIIEILKHCQNKDWKKKNGCFHILC